MPETGYGLALALRSPVARLIGASGFEGRAPLCVGSRRSAAALMAGELASPSPLVRADRGLGLFDLPQRPGKFQVVGSLGTAQIYPAFTRSGGD